MSAQPAAVAEDLLASARAAWRTKQEAEANLARLRRYRSQTPGMRDDADRALKRLVAADATLARVLGGQP